MSLNPFYDNVVLITGASMGIGRELALQLAEQGARLALASRSEDLLKEVVAQCGERGAQAISIPTDVTDEKGCQHMVAETVQEYGRIDTLINNAGIGMYAWFSKLPDLETIKRVMEVNYWGSVYSTYHALAHLRATKGRIVCVSSQAGLFPAPSGAGYAASKYALGGFFSSLRIELERDGVSVTMAYPGWVATGISTRALDKDGQPLGRVGKYEAGAMSVQECARLILKGTARRKRDVHTTLMGLLGFRIGNLVPGMVDEVARRTFT